MDQGKCASCGFEVFGQNDFFAICPICDWHNDPVQNDEPDIRGGANKLNLNEYRAHWPEIVRERRKRIKKIHREELKTLQNPTKRVKRSKVDPRPDIADISKMPKGSCGELPEKEMYVLLEACTERLLEYDMNLVTQFIAQKRGALGMEYLLWVIYCKCSVVSKDIYNRLKNMSDMLCLDKFYMEGITIEDEE